MAEILTNFTDRRNKQLRKETNHDALESYLYKICGFFDNIGRMYVISQNDPLLPDFTFEMNVISMLTDLIECCDSQDCIQSLIAVGIDDICNKLNKAKQNPAFPKSELILIDSAISKLNNLVKCF